MKQAVLSKYFGRAVSTVSSFSLTSNQKTLGLWGVFAVGFCTHSFTKYRERKKFWGKVDKLYDDYLKREQDRSERISKLLEAVEEY